MADNQGVFGPVLATAEHAVQARLSDLLERHAATPEEWQAFRVGGSDDGQAYVALLKPESLSISSLTVDGFQWHGGPGVVAMLGPDVNEVSGVAGSQSFRVSVVPL